MSSPHPKRTASPAPGGDAKRLRVTLPNQPQGATQVDLSNAPGKKTEAEPIASTDISNLPNVADTYGEAGPSSQGIVANPSSEAEPADEADVAMTGGGEQENKDGDEDMDEGEEPQEEEDAAALEQTRQALEEQARQYLAAQTQEIIIPSYSAWFDMSKINPIERKTFPEFFNGKNKSKTPATYKEYRDFMINTFRLRPQEYLTFTACRRNLAGDVGAIWRIHAFLSQWGLINYQVDPETRPASLAPPFTGHYRVILDTPRGLQPLHPGSAPPKLNVAPAMPHTPAIGAPETPAKLASANFELRQSIYQTGVKGAKEVSATDAAELEKEISSGGAVNKPTYACDTCGVDCTRERYHSLKVPHFSLCPSCYLDGRFPSTMYSGDFVRITQSPFAHASGEEWTDEEVLLLLEGIEMHDDDWAAISEHVGTRTREQCVQKFLQLPIEDPYIEAEADVGPLKYSRIPFEKVDNPVMSVVAFLAANVSPPVAAEAAGAALGELTEGLRKSLKKPPKEGAEEGAEPAVTEKTPAPAEGEASEDHQMADAEQVTKEEERTPAPVQAANEEETIEVDKPAEESEAPAVNGTEQPKPGVPQSAVRRAADLALKAAAARASSLATHEDTVMQSLVTRVVKAQLTKLEIKMTGFEQLEELLESERRTLEEQRIGLERDRESLRKQAEKLGDRAKELGVDLEQLGGKTLAQELAAHVEEPMLPAGQSAPMLTAL
ncbi:SWIRM-domain-containing protein [Dacryopinax primogenitus]|uniref:SWIRM-domain-containing protein n=1 Tax=Dacryopinax primogenitus (strain DJM 731) TaxID=1858805 RepID=M5GEF0_DACPD|nr:SWIRM-domain-containing protein [Dacryopinax primogenitus]EJU05377.1 SWIRM-domain-containing protein [Dacryopinax primogenitus]